MTTAARDTGRQVFGGIMPDFLHREDVDEATMFGSEALRLRGKVFAFVGREGALVVKLPAARARGLVDSCAAEWVRIGRNQAREWVAVPLNAGGSTWHSFIDESHAFIAAKGATPAEPVRRRGGPGPPDGAQRTVEPARGTGW